MTTRPRSIKEVGVKEFRDRATTYLSGGQPVAVSKHGRVIGFYIPVDRDQDEIKRALKELGELVQEIVKENGMSEEEFAQLFDLRQPLPE